MVHQLTQWATSLPAPLFIILLALLVFGSTGGIPMPVTLAIFLAGALTIQMPYAPIIFVGLLIAAAAGAAARDLLAFVVIRWAGKFAQQQLNNPDGLAPELQNSWLHRLWLWGERRYQSPEIQRARDLMEHRQWVLLCCSRLTPVTPIFNVGAVLVKSSVVAFLWGVFPGRLLFAALWLGAGAGFGNAWSKSANFMQLVSIGSIIIIVLLVLPAFIGHRLLQVNPASEPLVAQPIARQFPSRITARRTRPSAKVSAVVPSPENRGPSLS